MPAGQRGPLSTRGTSEAGGGIGSKIFCSSLGGTQIKAIPHKDCATDVSSNFSSDETKSGVNT